MVEREHIQSPSTTGNPVDTQSSGKDQRAGAYSEHLQWESCLVLISMASGDWSKCSRVIVVETGLEFRHRLSAEEGEVAVERRGLFVGA